MTNHEAQGLQQEKFGISRDGDGFAEQIVVLRIANASDCRGWYWDDIIDEPDVELIGWAGIEDNPADDHPIVITGQEEPDYSGYPQTPEEQVFCKHGNHIWFGHECGECGD